MRPQLLILALLIAACASNNNEDVSKMSFRGIQEGASENVISKITLSNENGQRYEIYQAVVQVSNGAIIKESRTCGDYTTEGGYFRLDLVGYGIKNYSLVTGFSESPYLADGLAPVFHREYDSHSDYIDSIYNQRGASCL